jgi:predicted nucleic-acid-binding Zn-ribbon protein
MHVFIRPINRFLACHACGGTLFLRREIKMTTTGMTFFDLDWANKSADGAICTRCGFVHTFMGQGLQWLAVDQVKPEDLPEDPLAGQLPAPPQA